MMLCTDTNDKEILEFKVCVYMYIESYDAMHDG